MTAGDAQAALESARRRHRERSTARRVATAVGGWLAVVSGLLVVLPLPEIGLPLLLVGLRILALRYDWAARAYLPVARLWERLKALPLVSKIVVGAVGLTFVGVLIWWLA